MLDSKYLNECFSYDKHSGIVYWKERPRHHFKSEFAKRTSNGRTRGKAVSSLHPNGKGKLYLKAGISTKDGKKSVLLHRAIWCMVYGEYPEFIDHIDGNGLNNKLENLRSVSMQGNNRNMGKMKTNTSGTTGVYKVKNRWNAMIWNVKQINLGLYDTKAEAIAARRGAEKALGYYDNGRR